MNKLITFTALVLASSIAHATDFPSKTISLVVPFAAGGPTDTVARSIAVPLGKALGQTVVVENKTGAGGTVAAAAVAKSAADGHTLLITHNGMATAPALYRKLAFNPQADFEMLGLTVNVPMTLLAKKAIPANTLPELITYIKANKDKIALGHAGLGAVSHLCGVMFQQAIGVDLLTVPFQGTAPAMTNLIGGQIDLLCDQRGHREALRRDHQKPDRRAARHANLVRARPERLRHDGVAWHLRTQGHA
jgi:tripartite-type tricarboxylate transporter receptor subunit TctC